MKYIFLLSVIFILSCNDSTTSTASKTALAATLAGKAYYASPTGSDNNAGTKDKPFYTWEKLASVLTGADTGYIRGGTYRTMRTASATAHCRVGNKSGTATNYIKMWAYPGESPVFDLSNIVNTGISSQFILILENASYWHIKGLRMTNFLQRNKTQATFGFYATGGTGNIIENCESDHNGYGFSFDKQINCQVTNCDGHHNQDPYSPSPYDGSDGFGSNGGQPANTSITFSGCRAWYNCDDGWDLYKNDGTMTFKNCWAFWNGYIPGDRTKPVGNGNGFKIGPNVTSTPTTTKKNLSFCLSFENRAQGYDQNDGTSVNQIINCTSYGNKDNGYLMCANSIKNILTNNISFADKNAVCAGQSVSTNNTWNSKPAVQTDFISTSSVGMDAPRKSNGDLPDNTFMHLANANQKGRGAYPDGIIPIILPPVVVASSASSTVVTFVGKASDPQGENMTYSWTQVDGTPVTIINGSQLVANATFTAAGTYHFKFTATNTSNLSSSTTIPVIIQ